MGEAKRKRAEAPEAQPIVIPLGHKSHQRFAELHGQKQAALVMAQAAQNAAQSIVGGWNDALEQHAEANGVPDGYVLGIAFNHEGSGRAALVAKPKEKG